MVPFCASRYIQHSQATRTSRIQMTQRKKPITKDHVFTFHSINNDNCSLQEDTGDFLAGTSIIIIYLIKALRYEAGVSTLITFIKSNDLRFTYRRIIFFFSSPSLPTKRKAQERNNNALSI